MKVRYNRFIYVIFLSGLYFSILGSNLTSPLAPIPTARVGIAASYYLGAHTITNREIPSLLNRFHCRLSYAPVTFFNIGIDAGLSQMDVASDSTAIPIINRFHGNYQFSYGLNAKVSTPLIKDIIGLVGIIAATQLTSEDKFGARYSGIDGTGSVGLLLHIQNFGYVSAGTKVYYIHGHNKNFNSSSEHFYSNINNVRGWFSLDYFPKLQKLISTHLPFFSFEISIAPDVAFNKRAPLQEMSFSLSLGIISNRLYGETSEVEWHP